jgi:hypothetical protein
MVKLINGPVNVIRLEGEIFGIKKVLYVFCDMHIDINNQTQCESWISQDFTSFLAHEFSKIDKNKSIDFFFETWESMLKTRHYPTRDKYIEETSKFFNKMIRFDKDKKNIGTEFGNNVRFHYIDIRDYFHKNIKNMLYEIDNIINNEKSYLVSKDVKYIIDLTNNLLLEIADIIHLISDPKNESIKPTNNYDKNKMIIVMKKLNYNFNHSETKKGIQPLLDNIINKLKEISTNLIDFNKLLSEYEIYIKKFNRDGDLYSKLNITKSNEIIYTVDYNVANKYLYDIKEKFDIFDKLILFTFAKIVDLYFLRRFIDKDYITTGISYTGIFHSVNYIHTLVRYFNMKITNASYIKDPIDKVNKELLNYDIINKDVQLFFYPPKLIQCSDLSSFPDNFN